MISSSSESPRASIPVVPILFVAALLAAGAGVFWFLERHAGDPVEAPLLTAEAKSYTSNLKLSDVEMKATESFLRQTVVEIVGTITNAGDRPVRHVELNCVFYDPWGEVVLRERVAIVRSRDGLLNPGDSRGFRLPFDAIPEGWNQVLPRLVIAQIIFG